MVTMARPPMNGKLRRSDAGCPTQQILEQRELEQRKLVQQKLVQKFWGGSTGEAVRAQLVQLKFCTGACTLIGSSPDDWAPSALSF